MLIFDKFLDLFNQFEPSKQILLRHLLSVVIINITIYNFGGSSPPVRESKEEGACLVPGLWGLMLQASRFVPPPHFLSFICSLSPSC